MVRSKQKEIQKSTKLPQSESFSNTPIHLLIYLFASRSHLSPIMELRVPRCPLIQALPPYPELGSFSKLVASGACMHTQTHTASPDQIADW